MEEQQECCASTTRCSTRRPRIGVEQRPERAEQAVTKMTAGQLAAGAEPLLPKQQKEKSAVVAESDEGHLGGRDQVLQWTAQGVM